MLINTGIILRSGLRRSILSTASDNKHVNNDFEAAYSAICRLLNGDKCF
jgi:hypothetical protein